MSVNWLWKDRLGYYMVKENGSEYRINLYAGNCLGVCIYEVPNSDEYQLSGFWNDTKHLTRCLGTGKNAVKDNIYKNVYKLCLNKYFKEDVRDISKCFVAANARDKDWNLTIEMYYEDVDKEGGDNNGKE